MNGESCEWTGKYDRTTHELDYADKRSYTDQECKKKIMELLMGISSSFLNRMTNLECRDSLVIVTAIIY